MITGRNEKPIPERPRHRLVRDADGRLRPAGEVSIGTEQHPISHKHKAKQVLRRLTASSLRSKLRVAQRLSHLDIPRPEIRKQHLLIGLVAFLALLVATGGYAVVFRRGGDDAAPQKGSAARPKIEQPTFVTILPEGKTIMELGGWARVSPPDKDPVFAFADRVGEARITVSEQPLPEGFKKDVAASMADLAKQFTANETINVDGTTAYVGTSIRGPQSVIVAMHDLLVLIKSNIKVPQEEWVSYIKGLQ